MDENPPLQAEWKIKKKTHLVQRKQELNLSILLHTVWNLFSKQTKELLTEIFPDIKTSHTRLKNTYEAFSLTYFQIISYNFYGLK